MTKEVDLVVIGAGLAGLATAVSAAEQGLQVALLEKRGQPGGTTALSGGWFAFSETPDQRALGIADTDRAFTDDMVAAGAGHADVILLEALAVNQHEAYTWIREQGIEFDVVKLSSGQSIPRSHHTNIRVLLNRLLSRIMADDRIELMTESPARELIGESGIVRGVTAEHKGEVFALLARYGVVIASGGFTRSPELIGRFAPAQVDAIPFGGLGNTGDGLLMALDAGAGIRDMEFISATYGSHPKTNAEEHELLTAFYMGAIIVNTEGRRFTDESISYKELGAAVLTQPGQLAYQVFDAVVRDASQPGVPLSDIGYLEAKGRLRKAETIEGLAHLMDVPATALRDTVDKYNKAIGTADDEFGRTGLCNGVGVPTPITTGPFYAYPAKALMTSTYCGVIVDREGRVLQPDGFPIQGLSAVGEVVGGYHGTGYVTGSALTKALVCGRVVARRSASQMRLSE